MLRWVSQKEIFRHLPLCWPPSLGRRRGFCNQAPLRRAVMSFGDGSHGALGLTSLGGDAYEPTRVPGLPSDVSSVSAGHYHSLAVTSGGEVWAWGRNSEAQLGRDLLASSPSAKNSWNVPTKVEGLEQVKVHAAFASGVISAAIGDDGSLWVWGSSKRGQLGIGEGITNTVVPSRVEALETQKIVKVSLGWGHSLALTEDGKLFGWGYSGEGRLGQIGRALETSVPTSGAGLYAGPQQISSSTLEIAESLVLESMEREKNMPIIWEPSLLEEFYGIKVVDIACGLDHSLVLCCDGTLFSGGNNIYGQLGRETKEYGMFPLEINLHPLSVSSGLGHSFAICQAGATEAVEGAMSIASWGWNQNYQLGRLGREEQPSVVEGLEGEIPSLVSGGRVHSIALTSKKQVWTWGCGKNGRLGLGYSADEVEPCLLESLEDVEVLQAVSGFDHNLILVAE